MNRNDFRNPLIQSGILLLVVFISISIVANSPADGFIGGIFALVSGLLKGLLFIVALSIGLVFSIAVLIGIYLMAVAINSVDKARTQFEQLKTALAALYCKVRCVDHSTEGNEEASSEQKQASIPASEETVPPVAAIVQEPVEPQFQKKIETLEDQINQFQSTLKSAEEQLLTLQSRSDEGQATSTELKERLKNLEASSAALADTIKSNGAEIASTAADISALENSIKPGIDSLTKEIEELHKKTSVPEVVSGILAYIDTQEERDILTERTEEAVSRGMTYSQTDEFFKKALPANVHKALSEHPRLTKDFIRSVKKKFE